MKVICDIYRSTKKQDMYLYVKKEDGLERVPEALLELFGKPEHSMTMLLTPEKKLARTTSENVLAALDDQGFYLQLPPQEASYMQDVNVHNSKLSR